MASNIDVTKPIAGNPTTLSVRDNFSASKTEIEALQAGTSIAAATLTAKGVVELATDAETNTGTDTGRAMTPSNLEAWTGSAQLTQTGLQIAFESTGIDDNATSTAITIDSSENVGIGTASPGHKLHTKGAGTVASTIESTDGTATSQIDAGGAGQAQVILTGGGLTA